MSKIGAAFLTSLMLAATPLSAAEAPHRIAHNVAWGCRDKNELLDLLFLGISVSFESKLASALAEGRCVYFTPGENVTIVERASNGIVRVERGGVTPVAYWTTTGNIN